MNKRNLSLDIFRGLTMALMVFVNDFWTVLDVPHWMAHWGAGEDGMGLSDIVYPMFLFAMGMSIPHALESRLSKGASPWDCYKHILSRTLALLLMGAFIVNSEEGLAWNKGVYWLLMVLGFFLIWNHYPKETGYKKWLQGAGIVLLAGLSFAYRSPEGGLFRASWWGILGQIGWMYLFASLAYLLCRERKWVLALLWGLFCLINLSIVPFRDGSFWIGGNFLSDASSALNLNKGHGTVMALGGVLLTLADGGLKKRRFLTGIVAAAVLFAMATAFHRDWAVSKIGGTLPWCLYVCSLSVLLYTLLRTLEKAGWTAWAKPLKPAGTATLTVYMIPYVFYSFWVFFNPAIPLWLSGWLGVAKCALFSALCIFCTWCLGRIGIKLKI